MNHWNRIVKMVPIYSLVLALFLLSGYVFSTADPAFIDSAVLPSRRCIILDAGHGGEDGGATSCTGILESQINLEITLRLDDLMHLLGFDTYLIRASDISVYTQGDTIAAKKVSDLKNRVKLVNERPGSVLISIHQNYFTDSRYGGAQIFYAKTDGSAELANTMQSAFVNNLNPGSHRKVKPAGKVYLMQHINTTGILVECGFLSNPEEEAKLRTPEYQKKICCVIASTCSQALQNHQEVA